MNENAEFIRKPEDVYKILEYAKLDRSELKPTVQCIRFSELLDSDTTKLIELDIPVLKHLQKGDSLIIRGDKTDSAVLCTNNKTYEIKGAETSNSLLLLPECSISDELDEERIINREVCGVVHSYYELKLIKPKIRRLQTLLNENVYNGKECEEDEDHQGRKYTFVDLEDLVQASEGEIWASLQELDACLIEGYWRILDLDFLMNVLNQITQLIEENTWNLDAIPLKDVLETLGDLFSKNIITHVLDCYGEKITGNIDDIEESDNEKSITYKLNEDKVCRMYAEIFLKHAGKFNFKEFLEAWQLTVPKGMTTSLHQLEGIALIDRTSKPEVAWHFPANEVPQDVNERFNFLFKTKPFWTLEEITPYIKDLVTEKVTIGALLTKYARASTQNGIKMYNSRRPVT